MDNNVDISEVQHSGGNGEDIRYVTRIFPESTSPEFLAVLGEKINTQNLLFDDTVQNRPEVFAAMLLNPSSRHYILGDNAGYLCAYGIIEGYKCELQHTVWTPPDPELLQQAGRAILKELFEELQLQRVATSIPAFNRAAQRFVHLNGFKFEGELRRFFLKEGKFWNTSVYSILKSEFRGN